MTRTLLRVALLLACLLTALPAQAGSNPNKALCKGTDYVFSVEIGGKSLSESVWLSWEDLYASHSLFDAFTNQGQCIAHVNHGGTLYFPHCAYLKGEAIRQAALCYTGAWLMSAAGQ